MKQLLIGLLFSILATSVYADINISEGTGKTVKAITEESRQVQLIILSTETVLVPTITSSDNTPITTAADTVVVSTPTAGNHIRVYYFDVSNSSTTTTDVYFRDGVYGTRKYRNTLPQYGIFAHAMRPYAWDLTSATQMILGTTAAGSVHYTIEYSIKGD